MIHITILIISLFAMTKASKLKPMAHFYKPGTLNQQLYVDSLNNNKIKLLFGIGPAGTGKTMFACNHAILELKSEKIKKIIITRPVIPTEKDEDIGFLPGDMNKKMNPWLRPILDVFEDFYTKKDINLMIYDGVIEISPLAFMRGRTFKNAFVIADEMQNSSPNQMKMLTTRLGHDSRMVVTGDLQQSDKYINNGLLDFYKRYNMINEIKEIEEIKMIEFNNHDIKRSPVVSIILDIYNESE